MDCQGKIQSHGRNATNWKQLARILMIKLGLMNRSNCRQFVRQFTWANCQNLALYWKTASTNFRKASSFDFKQLARILMIKLEMMNRSNWRQFVLQFNWANCQNLALYWKTASTNFRKASSFDFNFFYSQAPWSRLWTWRASRWGGAETPALQLPGRLNFPHLPARMETSW